MTIVASLLGAGALHWGGYFARLSINFIYILLNRVYWAIQIYSTVRLYAHKWDFYVEKKASGFCREIIKENNYLHVTLFILFYQLKSSNFRPIWKFSIGLSQFSWWRKTIGIKHWSPPTRFCLVLYLDILIKLAGSKEKLHQ